MEIFIKALLASRQALLIVFGVSLIIIGLSGGIVYSGWLPVPGLFERFIAGIIGAVLIGLSFLPSRNDVLDGSKISDFCIKITSPDHEEGINGKVKVKGTYEKRWPDNYNLRVLRGYPQGGFVPNSSVTCDHTTKTWVAQDFDIGGDSGDARRIEVWLVGQDGKLLLDTWHENHKVVIDLNRLSSSDSGRNRKWLPPIKGPTRDMHQCAWVAVRRS